MSSDHPCNVINSSGHSSTSDLSNESSDMGTSKACSPPNSSQGLDKPSTNPPQPPPNLFQAAAMTPDFSSDGDSESSIPFTSRRSARPPVKSPSRAHAQQPLEEEGFQAEMLSIAKLSMMERTHSAPGGIPFGMLLDLPGMNRPRRRLPVSIPEDRAVASTVPVDNAEAVDRPFHKVTNQHHAWQNYAWQHACLQLQTQHLLGCWVLQYVHMISKNMTSSSWAGKHLIVTIVIIISKQ